MRNFLQILKNIKVSKFQSLMGFFETAKLNSANFANFVMAKLNMLVVDGHDETSTYPRVLSRIAPVKYALCLVLMLMMGTVSAWGNTIDISGTQFDGKRTSSNVVTFGGKHVSFTLEGSTSGYYTSWFQNAGIQLANGLSNGGNKSFTFKWTVNGGCTLTVDSIRVVGTIPNHDGGYVDLGGSTTSKGNSFDVTKTNITGNSLSFTCYSQAGQRKKLLGGYENYSTDFNLTQVVIDYTIKPNAPTIASSTGSVNVSLSGDTTKLDMTGLITVSDVTDFMPVAFESNSFSDPQGVSTTGSYNFTGKYFYATKAGVYTFTKPYIAAKNNCHIASSKTNGTVTITVNRLNQTLVMNNGSVDVTQDKNSPVVKDLSTLIETHTGDGEVTYSLVSGPTSLENGNEASKNCTISGNNFYAWVGGTYTLKATAGKTAQYNAKESSNFTVTVNKKTQTISWSPSETTFVEEDVISATSIGTVTLSATGDGASLISIEGNTATVGEVESNTTATLTATAAQTDVYAAASDSKEITLTSLAKQHITFDQPELKKLKTTDATKKVELKATSDSNRDAAITYTLTSNNAGVSVSHEGSKWYLNYSSTAAKNIMVTAHLDGVAGTYVAASDVSQMVKVTDPNAKCDTKDTLETANGLSNTSKNYTLYVPKKVTVKVRSSKSRLYTNTYEIRFYDKNGNEKSTEGTHSWTGNSYNTKIDTRTFDNLDKSITKMVFKSNASNGFDITEVTYERWSYATPSVSALNYEAYALSTADDQEFTINYANYQVELSIEGSSNFVLKSDDSFGDCEAYGSKKVTVGYNVPSEKKEEHAKLYIKDNTGAKLDSVILYANVLGGLTQNITSHNIANSYKTTDKVTLTAETDRNLTNFSYSATPAGVANFEGNVMTFSQSGTIAITVTEAGNATFEEASTTVNNVKVNKDTPHIVSVPTGTAVTYLQTLNNSSLSGGSADITLRGVANTAVAGSFAWTSPNYQVVEAAGSHSYGVTFTPTDGDMYTTTTGSVSITVNKADQAIVMNNCSIKVAVTGLDANAADSKVDLDNLVQSQTTDPVNNNRTGAVTYEVIGDNKANATIATGNIFSATAIGTYTIRATKAETDYYNKTTDEFTVTVTRRTNTLTVVGKQEKYVDDPVNNVASVVNSDAEIHSNSSDATIAYYDKDQNKIIIPNSEAKSFDETTVYITIWQDQNDQFLASGEKTIEVKVKKYDNWFKYSWNGGSNKTTGWSETMNFDEEFAFVYSTQNAATNPTISQTDGNTPGNVIASYSNGKIKAYGNIGQAVWTLHQDENYKFKKADATMTVTVNTTNCPTCYAYKNDPDNTVSAVGEVGWGVDSVAGTLTFDMKPKGTAAGDDAFLSYWVKDKWDGPYDIKAPFSGLTESFFYYRSLDPVTLDAHTTRLKFEMGGEIVSTSAGDVHTDNPYVNNIRVTRLTWLELNSTQTGKAIDTLFINKELGEQNKKGTFQIRISTCDTIVKLTSNDSKVTLSETSIALAKGTTYDGGHLSNKNITVTYVCDHKDTTDAIISVYTKYEHKTFVVRAITKANTQAINWKAGYEGDTVALPVSPSVSISDAATASSGLTPVLYSTTNPAVIEISEDRLSFKVIATDTATLIASQAGNDEFEPVESSKIIRGSEKIIQSIVWERNFTRSLKVDQTIKLEASVDTLNTTTGLYEHSAARTSKLTYSCPNDNGVVEIIDSCYLHILAEGTTTITASVEGDSRYEGANYIKQVVVRPASIGCESHSVYVQGDKEEILFYLYDFNMPELTKTITFSPDSGMPDKLNFSLRGVSYHRVGNDFFDKNIDVYESSNNGATWTFLQTVTAYADSTVASGDIQLSRQTTMIKFVRPKGGQGYHYIEDLTVSRLAVLEADEVIDLGDVPAGSIRIDNIPFDYSDLKTTELTVKKGNGDETYNKLELDDDAIEMECGSFGTYNLGFSFKPTKIDPSWSQTVTVKDSISEKSFTVTLLANVTQGTQSIEWPVPTKTTFYTVQAAELEVQLTKKSNRNLDVTYSSSNNSIVSFSGSTPIINGYGNVTIYADCAETSDYKAAEQVSHDFTINRTPTEIVTAPTLPTIYGGTSAANVVLNTSSAAAKETVKNNAVEGTYAITSPATLNAGTCDVTITFTPSNTNLYLPSSTTILNVTIEQNTPTDAQAAVYADHITYGQQLNDAALHNNGTLAGTWTWVDEDANKQVRDAGTYTDLNVHFVPDNTNYAEIDGKVSVTVDPATPTGYSATASSISVGQQVSNSSITNTGIDGTWAWVNPDATYSEPNTYSVAATFTPADPNYESVQTTLSLTVTPPTYTYTGNGDWTNDDNWSTHEAPTEPQNVVINGNVTINTEVEVNSLTIEQGAQVTLTVNGQLTVGSGNSEYRENYGNLHVENEGHVILGSGQLKVNDFILDASLADIVESQCATSGQVTNPASLDVTGAAYFDLAFDPDGQVTFGWYDFTVPFEVNISNGIYRLNDDGSTTPMRSGSEFLIYRYDEAKRATGTKGWVNAGAVLNAGEAYTITLDYEMVKNVVRFVWNGNNSLGASYNCAVTRSETGDDSNRGWNGLGNGTLTHTELQSLPAQTKVQMYDHGTKAYKPVEAASYTYAVGTAFFYQVPNTDDVILSPAEKALPMRAPQHEVRTVDEFRLSLKTADTEREQDVMWVSASEDATTEYTVGHDLLKMTSLSDTKIAQMWVACGGLMLCDAEMPLTNNNASFPLEFYAPQAGSYSVAIERSPEDATLFLTYDGRIIWNLSMSEYPLELSKGTTQGYGLRLIADRQTTTDFEQTEATMQGVKKVLIDNQLYLIMQDGAIYTAEGKKVNE